MEGCPRISLRMRCRVCEFVVWKLRDCTPGELRDYQVYMIEATVVMIVSMMVAMIVASMKIMTIIMRTIFETTVMMMIMTTTIAVTVVVAKM